MHAAQIITAVIDQAGTDATRATVLSLLNEAYQEQVVRSQWLLENHAIGTVAAGTSEYSLPDGVVDIKRLKVGSYRYEQIGIDQLWDLTASGTGTWTGRGGLYSLTYSSTGGTSIALYPTPTESGAAIVALGPAQPDALTDSSSSIPITPTDTHGSLIDGTAALVLLRVDERPDLAGQYQQRFDTAVERLRRRKNSRAGSTMQALLPGVHY